MGWEMEQIGECTLYRGDCRDLVAAISSMTVLVTDPPYGVGLTVKANDFRNSPFYDGGQSMQASVQYDDAFMRVNLLVQSVIPLMLSRAPRAGIFCGGRLLHAYPTPASIGCVYMPSGAGYDPWGFGCFSPILYYGKDPYLTTGQGARPNSFTTTQPNREKIDHPCPKPVAWMKWLVNRVSLPGETIVDPFAGSFTTGVAAVELGRPFIGIEIERRYFEIGCARIEKAYRQLELFPLGYQGKRSYQDALAL
jgi:site-specific DNA-methyltransferase (adenine-specific)